MKAGDAVYLMRPCGDLDTETVYYFVKPVDAAAGADQVVIVATDNGLQQQHWHMVPAENVMPILKEA